MATADEKDDQKSSKKDPICDRSNAPHFFAASALLALTVVWAIADETWLRRPYKKYQTEFVEAAQTRLEQLIGEEEKRLKAIPEYQAAVKESEEAQKAFDAHPDVKKIKDRLHALTGELNTVRLDFQIARGDYQPVVYDLEHAWLEKHDDDAKELFKNVKTAEPRIKEIEKKLFSLQDEKAKLQDRLEKPAADDPLAPLKRQVDATTKARQAYEENLTALKTRLSGVIGFAHEIKQVYSPAIKVVDRCHTCHVGADKPGYDAAFWDGSTKDKAEQEHRKKVYSTHPNFLIDPTLPANRFELDYLSTHPVLDNRFGCTSCHQGNGPATSSAEEAHGLEGEAATHWDHKREFEINPVLPVNSAKYGDMTEASCLRCHETEVALKGGEQLSLGKQLIEDVGCIGCHKIKGFAGRELERENLVVRMKKEMLPRREKLSTVCNEGGNEQLSPEEARRQLAALDSEIRSASNRLEELDKEIKFIGPPLNSPSGNGRLGLRDKIYGRWLPRWISNPHAFRPGTWMPNPLLTKEEVEAVSAFIWQQAQGKGVADWSDDKRDFSKDVREKGHVLFDTKGCVACHLHQPGEGVQVVDDTEPLRTADPVLPTARKGYAVYDLEKWYKDPAKHPLPKKERVIARQPEGVRLLRMGPAYGPNLTGIGEKVRYGWLVEWLLDPQGVSPGAHMPSLRLTRAEAEQIAAFVVTEFKREGVTSAGGGTEYANLPLSALEDKAQGEKGQALVKRYGCYNCHSIDPFDPEKPGGLDPGKIGAELSSHGSKPLAQFDFAFIEVPHYRPSWLLTKILEPRVWDRGKYKAEPKDQLIMPRFGLTAEEGRAITTVLVGLVDEKVAGEYKFDPSPRQRAIIEGERLVKKFNCRSCHVIDGRGLYARDQLLAEIEDQKEKLPDPNALASDYLPPNLNGQGNRANPDWLFRFLKDPGQYGVIRPYHVITMPTFGMSDSEAAALTEYFVALENEGYPFETKKELERELDDPALVDVGRKSYFSKERQCYTCHFVGTFKPQTPLGPDLAKGKERLNPAFLVRFIPDPIAFNHQECPPLDEPPNMRMTSFFNSRPFGLQPPEAQREIKGLAAFILKLQDPRYLADVVRELEGTR